MVEDCVCWSIRLAVRAVAVPTVWKKKLFSLGVFPSVSLADVREKALEEICLNQTIAQNALGAIREIE